MDDMEIDNDVIPCALQVKEKWGTLRFYISPSTDEMEEAIQKAQEESSIVCEMCGNPGKFSDTGWCMVRCEGCKG